MLKYYSEFFPQIMGHMIKIQNFRFEVCEIFHFRHVTIALMENFDKPLHYG